MGEKRKEITYFFMILPAFLGFVLLFILPITMSFVYSFTNWSIYSREVRYIGLSNYISLFQDTEAMAAIKHSLKYALLITVIQNSLGILLAVALNKKSRFANFVKSITFLPAVLSVLVVGFIFQYIMTSADSGLLNSILVYFNFKPVNWLGSSKIALYSILATQVWQWTGWAMVIYVANLKSIDTSIYEAAEIDGANSVQKFFRVILPLMYPSISFNLLMSLIGGLKMFDAVFVMTKGGPGYATETIMTTLVRQGFNTGRIAYACAFAMVFFVIVFVLTKIMTYFFSKWEGAIS